MDSLKRGKKGVDLILKPRFVLKEIKNVVSLT